MPSSNRRHDHPGHGCGVQQIWRTRRNVEPLDLKIHMLPGMKMFERLTPVSCWLCLALGSPLHHLGPHTTFFGIECLLSRPQTNRSDPLGSSCQARLSQCPCAHEPVGRSDFTSDALGIRSQQKSSAKGINFQDFGPKWVNGLISPG